MPHCPYNHTACHCPESHDGKEPSVANRRNQRLSNYGANAGENISDEIVGCDAGGGTARQELSKHRGGHGKDEHAADTEEKVGYQLIKIWSVDDLG